MSFFRAANTISTRAAMTLALFINHVNAQEPTQSPTRNESNTVQVGVVGVFVIAGLLLVTSCIRSCCSRNRTVAEEEEDNHYYAVQSVRLADRRNSAAGMSV